MKTLGLERKHMHTSRAKYVGVLLFAMAAPAAYAASSEDQCRASWERADLNKDGFVSAKEITPYLIAIQKDGRHKEAIKDGKLDQNEFMSVCKDGVFEGINLEIWDARRSLPTVASR